MNTTAQIIPIGDCPTPGQVSPPTTGPATVEQLLTRIAIRRGCTRVEEVRRFLDPNPSWTNPLLMPDPADAATTEIQHAAHRAAARLAAAFSAQESVVIVGDYDVDGLSATAILMRLAAAAGAGATTHAFLPHRFLDDYGLTPAAVARSRERYAPTLLVAVDCGSSAHEAHALLRDANIELIVIDHHSVAASAANRFPGHLNPKAYATGGSHLANLCAAGLTACFAELVHARHGRAWHGFDLDVTQLLAGLATLADVVPLTGFNRIMVKRAVALARNLDLPARLPGLGALLPDPSTTSAWTFGFHLGPILNSSGRIDHATRSLKLLLAATTAEAEPLAAACLQINAERRSLQATIVDEAIRAAEQILRTDPSTKILVLAAEHWHPGVAGIVAARLRERYLRPAFVIGAPPRSPSSVVAGSTTAARSEAWKGSGRSIPGFDLGHAVARAVQAGCAVRGGGHAMAAGVTVDPDHLADFRAHLNANCGLTARDFTPRFEVLPAQSNLTLHDWARLMDRLEPMGAANPRPSIMLPHAVFIGPMKYLKRPADPRSGALLDPHQPPVLGAAFGVEVRFRDSVTRQVYTATWFAPEKAAEMLCQAGPFHVVLAVRHAAQSENKPGTPAYRWIVEHVEAASQDESADTSR